MIKWNCSVVLRTISIVEHVQIVPAIIQGVQNYAKIVIKIWDMTLETGISRGCIAKDAAIEES